MSDREKVIKGLDSCAKWMGENDDYACDHCPYHRHFSYDDHDCIAEVNSDAIALLKEQEPILLENQHKPYGISTNANSPWISRCPKCGKKVEGKQTRFCKYCGQAVKWE